MSEQDEGYYKEDFIVYNKKLWSYILIQQKEYFQYGAYFHSFEGPCFVKCVYVRLVTLPLLWFKYSISLKS